MTLAISMINDILPLHTKTQNYPSQVSQCGTLNAIMYVFFHFEELLCFDG